MKIIAISQPNYIPWRGYFDLIDKADTFVFLDCVQYTRRDWRNRNIICLNGSEHWLSIPVNSKGKYHQSIRETRTSGPDWAPQHIQMLRHAYSGSPFFAETFPWLENLYEKIGPMPLLADITVTMTKEICAAIGIKSDFDLSSQHLPQEDPSARLLTLCKYHQADVYLSGPAAKGYLDIQMFANAGVEVHFMDYSGYAPYRQLPDGITRNLSIVDLLFDKGPDSLAFVRTPRMD